MNIRNKLLLGGGLVALIPIVLTAALIGQRAYSSARDSLEAQVKSKLEGVRETKRAQIDDYMNGLTRSLQAMARSTTVIDAYKGYRDTFPKVVAETGGDANVAKSKAALSDYYSKEFVGEFTKKNAGKAPDMAAILNGLDPASIALQHLYISGNPQPLGKKEQLMQQTDPTGYSKIHAQFHPALEAAQKKFGYYDIFLVDTDTNRVVYTVFKELDFTSNLNTGIAAKSGLAEVIAKVAKAKSRDDIAVSDFTNYLASYNDEAAFLAVPIYDGEKQIGVMAIQAPLDQITATMTSQKKWKETGLGATGEVYLVGPDKLMRTDSRFALEDPAKFAAEFKASGATEAQVQTLVKKNTSVGLQKIDTEGVQKALAGQSGVGVYKDYRNADVLGAYAPFKSYGLNWALIAEQDADEVNAPIVDLRNLLLIVTLITALVLLALAGGAIAFFVRAFMRPVNQLQDTVQKIAAGDTAARAQVKSGDEMEVLGGTLDKMLDERIATEQRLQKENDTLNESVIGVLMAVQQLSQNDLTAKAPVTEDIMGTVADSINSLTSETGRVLADVNRIAGTVGQASNEAKMQSDAVNRTAQEERAGVGRMIEQLQVASDQMNAVSQVASNTNAAAAEATRSTNTALSSVEGTVKGMNAIRETISEVEKRIKRLGERSQEISQIVGLINTISERTHVLSLNASMQAAVAGEAGRGFAVVAEEVQRLAENSRNATQQIANLVQNIQVETNDTINTVNKTIDQVVQGSDMAAKSGEQMRETQATTARLVGLVEQISQSVQAQVKIAADVRRGADEIGKSTEQTAVQLVEQNKVTDSLVASAQQLVTSVSVFKLPLAA